MGLAVEGIPADPSDVRSPDDLELRRIPAVRAPSGRKTMRFGPRVERRPRHVGLADILSGHWASRAPALRLVLMVITVGEQLSGRVAREPETRRAVGKGLADEAKPFGVHGLRFGHLLANTASAVLFPEVRTFDINTGDEVIDGTPPGQTFSPLRYTTSTRDEIRVGTWLLLSTVLGTYKFDVDEGLDVEAIMDPDTSDAEIDELAADVVLSYPGVLRVTEGPTVSRDELGTVAAVTMEVDTVAGTVTITAPVA